MAERPVLRLIKSNVEIVRCGRSIRYRGPAEDLIREGYITRGMLPKPPKRVLYSDSFSHKDRDREITCVRRIKGGRIEASGFCDPPQERPDREKFRPEIRRDCLGIYLDMFVSVCKGDAAHRMRFDNGEWEKLVKAVDTLRAIVSKIRITRPGCNGDGSNVVHMRDK